MTTLVIVESPTKAKTISKFLGKKYIVKSSFGHLRDLPKNKMGVDVDNDFKPEYVISPDKKKTVAELKAAAKKTDHILFATDADREGEAISWHLAHILGIPEKKTERIVFHEITKNAIEEALQNPRPLDFKLVDAQQARRVLDRLVGYELSPFLWHKVAKGLSAGRVQSVAVRLIVEREREIQEFKPQEYWTLDGLFETSNKKESEKFWGQLNAIDDKKIDKFDLKEKEQVKKIISALDKAQYEIKAVEEKNKKRIPSPAFITSTLQQEANNHLGFSAKQTMRLAQNLYEGVELGSEGSVGLITYMRTDSVNLSEKFLNEAKEFIGKNYGQKYQLSKPRFYKNKSKNAQEAHEAIRPTEVWRAPEEIKKYLDKNQFKLYDLIWRRALATQMSSADINSTSISILGDKKYEFKATGQTIIFEGFLKLYPDRTTENILPTVSVGEKVNCLELKDEQHFTEPPARYSDATLVKILEAHGVGRPSTYAPTISTIESRGYVERDEKKKLFPKEIAYTVNDLLVKHFPHIVDYEFTAEMENNLDEVAQGTKKWQPVIASFYKPFKDNLKKKEKEVDKKEITEEKTEEKCDKCGEPMVIKLGRYGKFMACSGYPKCKNIKSLNSQGQVEEATAEEKTGEKCDKCGADLVKKMGRFGPFLSCSDYPKCKNIKSIENKVGVKCPKCAKGEIIQKKTRRGKIFFACNQYPTCDYALWDKPTGEQCPKCKNLLVFAKKGFKKCSEKKCSYTEEEK